MHVSTPSPCPSTPESTRHSLAGTECMPGSPRSGASVVWLVWKEVFGVIVGRGFLGCGWRGDSWQGVCGLLVVCGCGGG